MQTKSLCLVLGLSLVALSGCINPVYSPPPPPLGAYAYTSFDSDGNAIVRGWFTLVISPAGAVSGDWHFIALSNRQDIGPQIGEGQLTGSVTNKVLSVNLNPGWADNNVFLSANLENGLSRGSWEWSTFVGPTNHGSFEAVQFSVVE